VDGHVVLRRTVESVRLLDRELGPDAKPAVVAIEACREAWFVHDLLTSWGNEVLILDTTRTRQLGVGQHGRKTDRIDAEVIARALEANRVHSAHVLSPHRRVLRNEISIRRAMVETRAQHVTTVRGLMREKGIGLPRCSTERFASRVRDSALSEADHQLVDPLLAVIELANAQIEAADTRLDQLCRQEPVVQLLMTAPGVGSVVAATFVSVIDEAGRFRRAHELESYLGLVPSENTTGGAKQRLGSITKQGNSYLRALLVQSACAIIQNGDKSDPLVLWAKGIADRRGKKIAVIALARRLAGVLWAMWRKQVTYEPRNITVKKARLLRRRQSTEVAAAMA
jgi:transposase